METLVETPVYLLTKNNQAYNAIVKNEIFDPWEDTPVEKQKIEAYAEK